MQNLVPETLSPGDTIGVITPASPMDGDRLQRGCEYLRGRGYKVVMGDNVFQQRGYLAGSDQQRAGDINAMFRNPDVKAIFCSRGGYGSPRLLERIDYERIHDNPKIFIGYSDITTLELAIWHKTGLITFSGPMVAVEMGKGIHSYTEAQLWRALTDANPIGRIHNPPEYTFTALAPGKAHGVLIGGCLSTIVPLLGTEYLPDFEGAILFLEDIDEEPYRIDRYLAHLRNAGILHAVAGIVFGQFVNCVSSDPDKPSLSLEEVLIDYTAELGIPVLSGLAYGHVDVKTTMPVGVRAFLDADTTILEIVGAVLKNKSVA